MEETLYTLLPYAITAGISYTEFWDMTLAEVVYTVQFHVKREKSNGYELAGMMGQAVWGKLKHLYTIYPELFKDEARAYELSKFKANMLNYMHYNNDKRRKKEGGGDGGR